jgi:hypothetical protein
MTLVIAYATINIPLQVVKPRCGSEPQEELYFLIYYMTTSVA